MASDDLGEERERKLWLFILAKLVDSQKGDAWKEAEKIWEKLINKRIGEMQTTLEQRLQQHALALAQKAATDAQLAAKKRGPERNAIRSDQVDDASLKQQSSPDQTSDDDLVDNREPQAPRGGLTVRDDNFSAQNGKLAEQGNGRLQGRSLSELFGVFVMGFALAALIGLLMWLTLGREGASATQTAPRDSSTIAAEPTDGTRPNAQPHTRPRDQNTPADEGSDAAKASKLEQGWKAVLEAARTNVPSKIEYLCKGNECIYPERTAGSEGLALQFAMDQLRILGSCQGEEIGKDGILGPGSIRRFEEIRQCTNNKNQCAASECQIPRYDNDPTPVLEAALFVIADQQR